MIPYDCGNSNGKMNTATYIKILEQLIPDMYGKTLCQDKDSAHNSTARTKWAKDHDFNLLTLPGKSPDFSIIECMAHPIKRMFHAKRTASNGCFGSVHEGLGGRNESSKDSINVQLVYKEAT